MIKVLGLSVLFLTSIAVGLFYSERLKRRVGEIELMLFFLDRIGTVLAYQNLSTNELIETLSADPSCGKLPFLPLCAAELRRGKPFPRAWTEAVEKGRGKTHLAKEETDAVLPLAQIIGGSDAAGQLSALAVIGDKLKHRLAEAVAEMEKKGKLYRSLGALAGAGIVVLLF